jgi:hypothetical protein
MVKLDYKIEFEGCALVKGTLLKYRTRRGPKSLSLDVKGEVK